METHDSSNILTLTLQVSPQANLTNFHPNQTANLGESGTQPI